MFSSIIKIVSSDKQTDVYSILAVSLSSQKHRNIVDLYFYTIKLSSTKVLNELLVALDSVPFCIKHDFP